MLDMLALATKARDRAYSPYSHFKVGCCIQSESGKLYAGFNIENASYSLTLCAEASAIAAMMSAGENQIREVVITSSSEDLCPPCGACRQRLREFAAPHTKIHLIATKATGEMQSHPAPLTLTLAELLPHSFGPENLDFISKNTGN